MQNPPRTPERAKTPTRALNRSNVKEIAANSYDFRRYEILIEFKHLQKLCPTGMYLLPSPADLHTWSGVLFINSGLYKGAIFKFILQIPEEYPSQPPSIRFLNPNMFHPLVNHNGFFILQNRFSKWTPQKDYICHVLYYLKSSFEEEGLLKLNKDSICPGKRAISAWLKDRAVFERLAEECALVSSSDSQVYDYDQSISRSQFGIPIKPISDRDYFELRKKVLGEETDFDT